MSAFVCSEYHISYIVQAGIDYQAWMCFGGEYGYLTKEKAQHVYEVLTRENMRSVRVQYKDSRAEVKTSVQDACAEVGRFIPTIGNVTPLQTLKAIACLDYQSCETEAWPNSVARKYLDKIQDAAIRKLPGYEAGEWEIEDPTLKFIKSGQ